MVKELFTEIRENKRKAYIILGAIMGIFLFFNYIVWRVADGDIGVLFSGITLLYMAITYTKPMEMATYFVGAKKVSDEDSLVSQKLNNILEEMVIAGMLAKKPDLYIIESGQVNAFAISHGKKAAIGVTRGLVEKLNREEIKGVIAHEVSHIMHGDSDLKLTAFVFAAGVYTLGWLIVRTRGGGRRKNSGGLILVGLAAMTIGYLLALLMSAFMSRKQETAADVEAVRLTRDRDAFISALKKVRDSSKEKLDVPGTAASLFFSPPSIKSLFATHPPIEERIKLVEELA
ncbi:MAG: hypothetical protein D6769_00030 [Methanobacteriota archaeon]|nr:MAG: hypothetical protein D6769_00030 [Euryarchaeota archaeon]